MYFSMSVRIGSFTCMLLAIALVCGASDELPPIALEIYASGFSRPVGFTQDPHQSSVQFIVEQRSGKIRVMVDGVIQEQEFLNILDRITSDHPEQGLYSIAIPPDSSDSSDRSDVYVSYTAIEDDALHISRFTRDPKNELIADPDSEEVILSVPQPFETHNGGHIAFGPDGMLYITVGDGGSSGDPGHRAQDPDLLNGKILRIDVSSKTGYEIPPDNPFVDDDPIDALEEIWAFGVRNPWKMSFDDPKLGGTGAMIFGDVGQNSIEEINYEPAGAGGRNYGWRIKEGFDDFNDSLPPAYEPLTDPLHAYNHSVGRAAIGGIIYRGKSLGPRFYGRYFFSDFPTRQLWSAGLLIDKDGEATLDDLVNHTEELGGKGEVRRIPAFGVDADGELYVLNFSGEIVKIVPDVSTYLEDFEIIVGDILDGELEDLQNSDDKYLRIKSGHGTSLIDLHHMEIIVSAVTTVDKASTLNLTIESHIDELTGLAQIRLRNWKTNQFESVGSYSLGSTDQINIFEGIDASSFIDDESNIDLSIKHLVFVPFLAFTFDSFLDQVDINVN